MAVETKPLLPTPSAAATSITSTSKRRSCLFALFFVLCFVGGLVFTNSSFDLAITRKGDRQPTTGGFEFQSSFSHLTVEVEGSDVGDCRVIVDLGTSALSHVVFSIESDRDDAQDETTVTAELKNQDTLSVKVWFPDIKKAKRLHSDVRITIPHQLLSFFMNGNAASLVWEAGNIQDKLDVTLNVGSARFYSPLNTSSITAETNVGSFTATNTIHSNELTVDANTGSVSLTEAIVSGPVQIKSNTGSIIGAIRAYQSLSASVKTGTVHLSLYPGVEGAQADLKSKTGSVNADVYGFVGNYKAKTNTGSVKVSGNIHKTGANTGWVGSKDGLGLLEAATKSGSVDLTFFK
ncbi:UNVERIFIED_CONTAM: hypothetical protein HDU68_012069 [Siphonaria sp. JEL0065]|nr:hypothetical protein HDU68_012069 [Siphonaria sp. JEL0065]